MAAECPPHTLPGVRPAGNRNRATGVPLAERPSSFDNDRGCPGGEPVMDYPAQRRQQLARCLDDEGLDALLVSSPVNVTYLTGFSGDSSYLVLGRQRTVLVSDARFTEQIAAECPGLETHIRPPVRTIYQAA